MKNLYNEKRFTTFDIASLYGCCQATIWKRLHEYNIRPRLPGLKRVSIPKKELKNLYGVKRLSTWKIEKSKGIPRGTIYRKLKEYNIKTRNISESHVIYPKKDFTGNLVEKAYLIGFRLGDLRVRKVSKNSEIIHVDCGSTKMEQISLIRNLFSPYTHVWVSKPNKKGKIQIETSLNLSFNFLLSSKVPKWITASTQFFIPFIAGFVDAEGSFFISKGQGRFSIGNYNKDILLSINAKLRQVGIKCLGPYESNTKDYLTKEGYRHNQNYYHISVARKNSLLKLIEILAPHLRHEKRIKDMYRVKENIILRNSIGDNYR